MTDYFEPSIECCATWCAETPSEDGGLYIVSSPDSDVALVDHRGGPVLHISEHAAKNVVLYLRIDPLFALNGDEWTLVVDYLDHGNGGMLMEYSSRFTPAHHVHQYSRTPILWLANSRAWLSSAFVLIDPRFTRACNLGDIRLIGAAGTRDLYIRAVRLHKRCRVHRSMTERGDHVAPRSLVMRNRVGDRGRSTSTAIRELYRNTSIIIPTYNQYRYTRLCLRELVQTVDETTEIIIVDNNSKDGTADKLAESHNLTVIRNSSNLGFAAACNIAAENARGDFLVFLNNDTIPLAGWLEALLGACSRDSSVGVVGARLIYPQTGEIQHAGISFDRDRRPYHRYRLCPADTVNANREKELRAVTGACMLVRKDVFEEVHGFDEKFLNGLEDVDLCMRIRKVGRKILYCPSSVLYHFESASMGRLNRETDKENTRTFRRRWSRELRRQPPDAPEFHNHLAVLPMRHDGSTLKRRTGRLVGSVVECRMGKDRPGHCTFGPDLFVGERAALKIRFVLEVSAPGGDLRDKLVSVDVYDNWNGEILVFRTLDGTALSPDEPTSFDVELDVTECQVLEFRVYWHGNCDLRFHHAVVDRLTPDLTPAPV